MTVQEIRLPNCFIIGAQKSGTTTLAEMLAAHPNVTLGRTKELNVWGCHDEEQRRQLYAFWQKPQAKLRLDASPFYLFSDRAMKHISDTCDPDSKIIILLREPVSRAVSSFWHAVSIGVEHRNPEQAFCADAIVNQEMDLEAVIEKQARRTVSAAFEQKIIVSHVLWKFPDPLWLFYYLAGSHYSYMLSRVFQSIDRQRALVMFTDELKANRDGTRRKIMEFLELDDAPMHDVPDANIRLLPRDSWKAGLLRKAKNVIPRSIRSQIPSGIKKMYGHNAYERPSELDSELRSRLQLLFKPELPKLAALLERDLPQAWSV